MATAQSEMDVRVRGIDDLSPELSKIESNIIRFVGAVSASLAAIRIGTAPIAAARDFERELANVTKTTGFVDSQVKLLSSSLLDLSLRINTSTLDLAKIAAAAGQQGLGREGVQAVVQFTESVSRMSSVLDITADVAGASVGKILNIFRIPIQEVERIASAFNQVSNNSTARGEELLDVVKRIGDATGAINLQQSLGLAASGIDFGVSPEVVGTAFSRVFAQMNSKAEAFGKLLNLSATDWIRIVQNDGIAAFKMVIERLRTLEPQSQQETIAKLLGGGRIGALINKFVQDASNEVLDRNLKNAQEGFTSGLSAIKEQATVLDTFKEQFNIFKNSLFKTGVEIGDQALGPLTSGIARLSQALQSDGFRSFAQALGRAVAALVTDVTSVIEFIGRLNINWENFLSLAKIFIELKLAQVFLTIAGRITGVTSGLQSIATSAAAATAAQRQLASASTAANTAQAGAQAGFLARTLGIQNEVKAIQDYIRAKREQAVAAAQAEAAQQRSQAAQGTVVAAAAARLSARQQDAGAASQAVRQASAAASAASAAYRDTLARSQAAEAALIARQQASITQKANAHNQALMEIEQRFAARKAEIKATGTQTGLKAARAQYAQELADEQARHLRSNAQTEAYWARQLAITRAGATAQLNAQKATLAAANTTLDTNVNNKTGAAAAAAAAGAALATAKKAQDDLVAGNANLVQTTATVTRLQSALSGAGVLFTSLFGIIQKGAAIALRALGWVAVIYTLADAFGLLDAVGGALGKIAESMGLVTRASAEQVIKEEALKRAEEEKLQRLEDLAAAYNKLKDASSGQVSDDTFTSIEKGLQSGLQKGNDGESAQVALSKLGTILSGTVAQADAANARITSIAVNGLQVISDKAAAARAELEKAEKTLALIQSTPTPDNILAVGDAQADVNRLRDILTSLEKGFTDGQVKIEAYKQSALNATTDLGRASSLAAQLLTDDTLKALQQFLIPLKVARDEQLAINKAIQEAQQAARTAGSEAEKAKAAEKIQALKDQAELATKRVIEMEGAFKKFINTILTLPGASTQMKETFAALNVLSTKFTTDQLKGLEKGAVAAQKAGVKLTGALAPSITPKPGKDSFNAKDKEGEAKRLARAQVDAARQLSRNQINEAKAAADEINKIEQSKYDQGLLTLQEYYNERAKMSTKLFNQEIAAKKEEEAQISKELGGAAARKDPAEKVKLESDLSRVRSEIRVLAQQAATQQNEINNQRRRAQEQFTSDLLNDSAKFIKEGLVLATPAQVFDASLALYLDNFKKRLNELDSAAKQGDEQARQTAERIRQGAVFQAAGDSIDAINNKISNAFSSFDNYTQKLEILKNAGVITGLEAREAIKDQSVTLATEIQQRVTQIETELDRLRQNGIEQSAPAFQTKLAELDSLRIKLVELQTQADKTALAINQNITDSLANGLGKLEPTFASLKSTLLGFIKDVASNIQQTIGRDLAEYITTTLGGGGSGGLGGLISNALGSFRKENPATPGGQALAKQLGATAFAPLYVKEVSGALGGGGAAGILGQGAPLEDLQSIFRKNELTQQAGGDLNTTVQQAGKSFLDTIQGGLGSIGSSLTGLFSQLLGGGGGGGGDGGFLGLLVKAGASYFGAPTFHRGGTVGGAHANRLVDPMVFRHARRYHNGGIAGLAPNEVPAILEKGEEVISNRDKNLEKAAGGAGKEIGIRNVLVTDPNFISDGMAAPEGERTIVSVIQRNRAAIKQLLR